jgi:hypothetical protein
MNALSNECAVSVSQPGGLVGLLIEIDKARYSKRS